MTNEADETAGDDQKDDEKDVEKPDSTDDGDEQAETPELSDEGKEEVKQMQAAYDDDRPTAVLPGTDNTITGVAVNEWLDDDGNPKFGKDEQDKKDNEQDKDSDEASDKQTEDAS